MAASLIRLEVREADPVANAVAGKREATLAAPPRWLLSAGRWPALLVRVGAGRLIQGGMAIVTHRGRRSGRIYQTAVQVLERRPATGEIFVVAWSKKADWFRNIQQAPAVEVWDRGKCYKPIQRFLTKDEIAASLLAHRARHRFQAGMRRLFIAAPRTEAEAQEYANTAGGVVFRPAT